MAQDNLDAFLKIKGITGECHDAGMIKRAGQGVMELSKVEFKGTAISKRSGRGKGSGGGMFSRESDTDVEDEEEEEKPFTLQISKLVDSASPILYQHYCIWAGQDPAAIKNRPPYKAAKLWVRKAGVGKEPEYPGLIYFTFEFTELKIISFSWDFDSSGEAGEDIEFQFNTCLVKYRKQDITGGLNETVIRGYDFKQNKLYGKELGDGDVK